MIQIQQLSVIINHQIRKIVVITWDCPQELDGKTWEHMEKQQTLQESSRPFRRFEVTISFRISQAFKYHPWPSNKTWPFLKLKLEQSLPQRGGKRTKNKITAETVAPFSIFQYLSVVAQVKRNFMKYFRYFQMLFVTWSELVCMSTSFCSETLAETGEGPAQAPQTQKQVAWPTAVLNQLESQGEKLSWQLFHHLLFHFSGGTGKSNEDLHMPCPRVSWTEFVGRIASPCCANKSTDCFILLWIFGRNR